jgi:predicted dehydrogenase
MAKHSIGIGVIGMGWMGQAHSRAYNQMADRYYDSGIRPRLVICADDVAARAERAKEALRFEGCTTDWHAVINHPEVQVVNVASPNYLHLEMVRAAAAAGKHVFCEKPVGRTPEETVEVEYAARKAGVMSFVGFNYRWAPMVQYAKKLIDEGKLGDLTHYRGRFFSMYGSNPMGLLTWRFKTEFAGTGVLGDLGSHVIDMALMLMGPIERVAGQRNTFIKQRPLPIPGQGTHFSLGKPDDPAGPVENEDYMGAMVQFKNGVVGTFEACRAIYGPKCEMAFEVNGNKGATRWNFERMNELDLYLPDGDVGHDGTTRLLGGPAFGDHGRFNPGDGIGMGYEDLKAIEAYNFLQSIVDGKQRAPSFADALHVAEVQTALIRSWENGGWENIPSLRKE